MNVAIFWDIPPCSLYVNRRFGGAHCFYLQGEQSAEKETSVQQVVTVFIVPSHLPHAGFLLG
jgi:hypothetical protein